MPRRSNEFQKLLFMLKRHLGPEVTVVESRMLPDLVTGTEREVDICLETNVGGHKVLVAVECRDRSRPADVTWVEEMKARHDRLPTHALVLVSRSGFTKEAVRVAVSYGIETLKLNELTVDEADRLFGSTSSLWGKVFTLTVTKVVMSVPTDSDLPAENVRALPDNYLYTQDGTELGQVSQLVALMIRSDRVGRYVGQEGKVEHTHFVVEWEGPKTASGQALCLRKIQPDRLRPIEKIRLVGTCKCDVTELPLQRGEIGGVQIAWATGSLDERDALFLASQDTEGNKTLSLTISGKIVGTM